MAVINRQYEALNTMFLNGHSPCVLDGKLCNPMYYACVHGDWKLAAVLRVLYLVPILREREQKDNADSIDDSLMAASIEGNHEHVLMTLLLLNAPLSNAGSEIVIEEGQISTHDFPVPLLKAFKLKNSNTSSVQMDCKRIMPRLFETRRPIAGQRSHHMHIISAHVLSKKVTHTNRKSVPVLPPGFHYESYP